MFGTTRLARETKIERRTKMDEMMRSLNEAMDVAQHVLEASENWDDSIFLALIGLLVDQKAANMGKDAMSVWDELYAAASGVNANLGPMTARKEQ